MAKINEILKAYHAIPTDKRGEGWASSNDEWQKLTKEIEAECSSYYIVEDTNYKLVESILRMLRDFGYKLHGPTYTRKDEFGHTAIFQVAIKGWSKY